MTRFLALFALTLAVCHGLSDVPAFTLDREYVYEFRSRVGTGVAKDVRQFAGAGLKSQLIIQNQGDFLLVKLNDPKYGEFNREVDFDIRDEFRMDYSEQDQLLNVHATKPVRVHLEKGIVTSFEVQEDEPEYTVNFKRAILSLLQLNLDRVDTISSNKYQYEDNEDNKYLYRVIEDGVTGKLETVYEINSQNDERRPHEQVLNVTKHRLTDRAITRPTYVQTTHIGQKIDDEDSTFKPLRITAQTKYNLRGDRKYFTIEKIISEEEILFAPFSTNGETIITLVNQTLTLVEKRPIQNRLQLSGNTKTYTSLTYNPFQKKEQQEGEVDLTKANQPFLLNQRRIQNAEQFVQQLIQHLTSDSELTEQDSEPVKLVELIETLRTLDLPELEQIYQKYVSLGQNKDKQQKKINYLLLQVLPILGTNPSVKLLLQLIEQNVLPYKIAAKLFDGVPAYVRQVSEKLIDEILRVADSLDKTEKRELQSVLLLAAGTLLNRGLQTQDGWNIDAKQLKNRFKYENGLKLDVEELSQETQQPLNTFDNEYLRNQRRQDENVFGERRQNENVLGERRQSGNSLFRRQQTEDSDSTDYKRDRRINALPLQLVQRYNKEFVNRARNAQSNYELNLYLRVLGNIGLPESFPVIRDVVKSDKSAYIKSVALFSLRPAIHQLRDEILNLANPIFKDEDEELELRVAAFKQILASKPTFQALLDIAKSLPEDKSQQLASYVYNVFVEIANSTNPVYKRISKDLRQILQIVKPFDLGLQYSNARVFNYFNDKYQYGKQFSVSYLVSNESIVPEAVNFQSSLQILGYNFDLIQFGQYTKGLKRLAQLLLSDGSLGPLFGHEGSQEGPNYHPRQVNTVRKELDEIREKINQKPRQLQPIEIASYVKLLNKNFQFRYYEEDDLANVLNEEITTYFEKAHSLLEEEGKNLYFAKYVQLVDTTFEVPTISGLPYFINVQAPTIAKLDGQLKVDLANSGRQIPSDIKISTDLKAKLAQNVILNVGVFTPSHKYYTYGNIHDFSVKLPLKLEVDVDVKSRKLNIKYKPTQVSYKPVYYKATPYTAVFNGKNDNIQDELNKIKPIHYTDKPIVNKVTLGQKLFGVGFEIFQKHEHQSYNGSKLFEIVRNILSQQSRNFDYDYEHIPTLFKRLYKDIEGLKDYILIQPSFKPYKFGVVYEPNQQAPTTEIDFTLDLDVIKNGKNVYPVEGGEESTQEQGPIFVGKKDRKVIVLNAELKANGPAPRKFAVTVKVVPFSFEEKVSKLSIEYERTAIPEYDDQPLKLSLHRTVRKTYPSQAWYSIDTENEQEVETQYQVNFGTTGTERKINVKILAQRSEEQKRLDDQPTAFRSYRECQKQIAQGYNMTKECFQYFVQFYMLNKQTVEITYENLPESLIYLKNRLSKLVRYALFPNYDVQTLGVNNPEGVIRAELEFHALEPRLDVGIQFPKENVAYYNIPYKYYLPLLIRTNARLSYLDLLQKKYFKSSLLPMCLVQDKDQEIKDEVVTFDGVNYLAELNKNAYVLFKDNSKKERFTVLVKKVNHVKVSKALKVFVENHKVEILPVGENDETAPLIVRVDGVKQVINQENIVIIKDEENQQKALVKVYLAGPEYVIKVPKYGFKIFYNGLFVRVEATNFLRGRLSGLCGEFDGERYHEFTGPQGRVYYNAQTFANSYAIPEGSESVQNVNNEEYFYPQIQREGKRAIRRNKVIRDVDVKQQSGNKVNSVCFSTVPIPECAEGYKPTEIVQRRVGFHCLNAKDDAVNTLIQKSEERELTELSNKSRDIYEIVSYPEDCAKTRN